MMQRQGRLVRSIVVSRSDVGSALKILLPNATGRATITPIQTSSADFMVDSAEKHIETPRPLANCGISVGKRWTSSTSDETV
jgi:hypothetical protein